MNDIKRERIGRLRWHCRRALLELDLVFQRFWNCYGNELDEQTEADLRKLLALEDHDLWDLVSGREQTQDPQLNRMVEVLRRLVAAPEPSAKTLTLST
jgi:antitoxin CptB